MEITRDKKLSRRDRLIASKAVETKPIRTNGTSSQETEDTSSNGRGVAEG